MSDTIYALISGEIAESKKISHEHLGRIPDIIRSAISEVNLHIDKEQQLDYEIIRMDEFLCLSKTAASALHTILMLASEFRSRAYAELNTRMELRLSIGIGPVELFQGQLRESDGTAFRLADEGLRTMKRNQRLMISTGNKQLDGELHVSCGFMDILIHDWSDEQAEALFLRLSGKNQMEISEQLQISQPAVNRRLKAAHLEATEKFLERYSTIITE
jgi:hypothetical protein